jgi:hypothetical protein
MGKLVPYVGVEPTVGELTPVPYESTSFGHLDNTAFKIERKEESLSPRRVLVVPAV